MTTLVKAYPYNHFFLGKIAGGDLADLRAAEASLATENSGVVTIATHATTCQDFAYAITGFTPTEAGNTQDVTNLASRAGQTEEGRPTWEAPCTMRVYASEPSEDPGDSVHLTRDHAGKYVLYAEHANLGKLVAVVLFDGMTQPFIESGELIVTFTLRNAGRYLPKSLS
jgi:hypothetical protein